MFKVCNKCSTSKETNLFGPDKRNKDGKQGTCRPCMDADKRKRRERRASEQDYRLVADKTCNKCRETHPACEFFKDKAMSDGLSSICKRCKRVSVYTWREKNKEKYNADARAYSKAHPEMRYGSEIKRRYGCTLEQYNAMLVSQNGKCALCDKLHNPAEKKGRLYVDHCHESGQVRALLCGACNSMLGYACDDVSVLQRAIEYLQKHK